MLGTNVVDEELKRGFGLSIKEIEPSPQQLGGRASRSSAPSIIFKPRPLVWWTAPAPGTEVP